MNLVAQLGRLAAQRMLKQAADLWGPGKLFGTPTPTSRRYTDGLRSTVAPFSSWPLEPVAGSGSPSQAIMSKPLGPKPAGAGNSSPMRRHKAIMSKPLGPKPAGAGNSSPMRRHKAIMSKPLGPKPAGAGNSSPNRDSQGFLNPL
jgi:hypothetical protein